MSLAHTAVYIQMACNLLVGRW